MDILLLNAPTDFSRMAKGENGLLFNPYDAKQMAQKIGMVLADNIFAERLGKNARAFVIKNYNIKNLLEMEVKLLTKVGSKKNTKLL